jgi:DUF1365 family protein
LNAHSAIYEGFVRHRRFHPVENTFRYRLFMMYLDLDELPALFSGHPLWSAKHFNLACFRRRDHLGDPSMPLARAVRDLVAERSGKRLSGPIRLLTHLRYFGHCFNPVSFYYCFDPSGCRVETIVAEINNTPWHERHCYLLDEANTAPAEGPWKRFQFHKDFHVSPFMGMDIDYDWRFRDPDERISIHMINFEEGERLFDATLSLGRSPITKWRLTAVLLRYPFMTMKVVAAIYRQAWKLKRKKAPFYAHPVKSKAGSETGS